MRAYYDPDGSPALAATASRAERNQEPMLYADRNLLVPILLLAALLAASGCVYRANMSQGNIVIEEDLDQVELDMTRNQVRFLLGTPMVDDPFHANRWDYVYYVKIGRRDATAKRWVSIMFADDRVTEIRRDQELNPKL